MQCSVLWLCEFFSFGLERSHKFMLYEILDIKLNCIVPRPHLSQNLIAYLYEKT